MQTITTKTVQEVKAQRRRDHMQRNLEFVCQQADVLAGAFNVQVTPHDVKVLADAGDIDEAFVKFGVDKNTTTDREHTTNGSTFRSWRTHFDGVEVQLVEVTR